MTPAKRIWVEKTEEKSSDVNITSHLVRDACFKRFDVAVLITNDSDLAEPVRIVREEFELPIGVLNPHEHHSVQLKKLATFRNVTSTCTTTASARCAASNRSRTSNASRRSTASSRISSASAGTSYEPLITARSAPERSPNGTW